MRSFLNYRYVCPIYYKFGFEIVQRGPVQDILLRMAAKDHQKEAAMNKNNPLYIDLGESNITFGRPGQLEPHHELSFSERARNTLYGGRVNSEQRESNQTRFSTNPYVQGSLINQGNPQSETNNTAYMSARMERVYGNDSNLYPLSTPSDEAITHPYHYFYYSPKYRSNRP